MRVAHFRWCLQIVHIHALICAHLRTCAHAHTCGHMRTHAHTCTHVQVGIIGLNTPYFRAGSPIQILKCTTLLYETINHSILLFWGGIDIFLLIQSILDLADSSVGTKLSAKSRVSAKSREFYLITS